MLTNNNIINCLRENHREQREEKNKDKAMLIVLNSGKEVLFGWFWLLYLWFKFVLP
jgi:hypothetical protein